MIENWANFLPNQLDPSISIFGAHLSSATTAVSNNIPASPSNHHIPPPFPPQPGSVNGTATTIPASSPAALKSTASASQIINSSIPNSANESLSRTPPPRPSAPPIPPRSANSTPLPHGLNLYEADSKSSASGGSLGKLNLNSTEMESNANSTSLVASKMSLMDEPEHCTTALQMVCIISAI